MSRPTRTGRARRSEHRREPFAVDVAFAAARGPRDDASGNPRRPAVAPWPARSSDRRSSIARDCVAGPVFPRDRVAAVARVPRGGIGWLLCRAHAAVSRYCSFRLEVGDHLGAFVAAQRPGAGEVLVGVAPQAQQRRAPRHPVGFEHRELFGGRLAVDLGLDVLLELPVGDRLHGRRRGHGRRFPGRSRQRAHYRRRHNLAIRASCSAGKWEDTVFVLGEAGVRAPFGAPRARR